jgi:hypothetical protein
MQDILYNLNSVEESYGESALTGIIQIYERIREISDYVSNNQQTLNDFEKEELRDRLDKLLNLNFKIRSELELQVKKLTDTLLAIR